MASITLDLSSHFSAGTTINVHKYQPEGIPLGNPVASAPLPANGQITFDVPEGMYVAAADGNPKRVTFSVAGSVGGTIPVDIQDESLNFKDVTASFTAVRRQVASAPSTSATEVVALDAARTLLEILNAHDTIGAWIAFGDTATVGGKGWYLKPGESYRANYSGAVSAITASGTGTLCIIEW